jgi:hypothetical protein
MQKATDKVRGCVVLDRKTTILVDDYRRKQPAIPTRHAVVVELIKLGLASLAAKGNASEQRGAV